MKLYEVDDEIELLLLSLSVEEDDDNIELLESKLEALEMERDQLLLNIHHVIRNAMGEAHMIREEEKRLAAKRKRKENLVDRLLSYVREYGGIEQGQRWEKFGHGFKWTTGEAVVIDEAMLPMDSKYVRVLESFARDVIKRDLKAGIKVPGARLEKTFNLKVD